MRIENSRRQSGDSNGRNNSQDQGATLRKGRSENENNDSVWSFKGSDNEDESQDSRRTYNSERTPRPQSRERDNERGGERRATPERRSYPSRERDQSEAPRRIIKKQSSSDNSNDRQTPSRYRDDESNDNRRGYNNQSDRRDNRDSRNNNEYPRGKRVQLIRRDERSSDDRDERRPRFDKKTDIRQRSEQRLQDRNERYKERERSPRKVIGRAKKVAPKDDVRLNKFIANSGVCSRREADEYIEAGVITVNGVVVNTLGSRIKSTDEVRFNDQRLQGEKKVYILLNKPKNYVTTVEDPHADSTVMDLIKGACKERVYPVGRLDKNTTGVLLFTNDGELTKELTHPAGEKMKIYHVYLDKNFAKSDLQRLVDGFTLEDGFIQADAAEYVEEKKDEVGVEIHSGRNRIVRRMFEHLGYKVIKLDRVYFAGLTKKGLKRGAWRVLTPKEISILKMGQYE